MKKADVRNLVPGLYLLHWKSGGKSLAAVGMTCSGGRWMAPINWEFPTEDQKHWRVVKNAARVFGVVAWTRVHRAKPSDGAPSSRA